MSKALKTPLRYPGGKSRAVPKLFEFLPKDISEFREPFLGGGSMAIAITKQYPGIPVWVNDLYEPLVNFWIQLRDHGETLSSDLADLKGEYDSPEKARGLFNESKGNLLEGDDIDRAVAFYIVNKCSFSGLTESSSFSPQASNNNWTMRGIDKLPGYSEIIKDWKITCLDYADLVADCTGHSVKLTCEYSTFIYVDPPYSIKDFLYGEKGKLHKGFDHERFANVMDDTIGNVMISYNDNTEIRDRFWEWSMYDWDHTYTMRSTGDYMKDQKARRELLLTNYTCQKEA
tara:strand:- start:4356 stop:5216 length:861 start_codon:yes stop_codon:yes gene_type:complete